MLEAPPVCLESARSLPLGTEEAGLFLLYDSLLPGRYERTNPGGNAFRGAEDDPPSPVHDNRLSHKTGRGQTVGSVETQVSGIRDGGLGGQPRPATGSAVFDRPNPVAENIS